MITERGAAGRRNTTCEKEPHETGQRAACGSRAAGWPPLLYDICAAPT